MKDSDQTPFSNTDDARILRDQVYENLRDALMRGAFVPGQKLVIRQLAAQQGTSLTPIREGLRRLVAEGVLEGEANRSVRVPRMTSEKFRELWEIRLAVEALATRCAAERISEDEVSELRRIAGELLEARAKGDVSTDVAKLGEFQLGLYRASRMPNLIRIIESLWLQTGPYLKLLFPAYVKDVSIRRGNWRLRLCDALEAHETEAAVTEIVADLNDSLGYLSNIVTAAETIGQ